MKGLPFLMIFIVGVLQAKDFAKEFVWQAIGVAFR